MEYKQAERRVKSRYDRGYSRNYRESDEVTIETANHRHRREMLEALSASFGREISVLDIGCGTGRYFHCLRNTKSLTGIDVSEYMIDEARNPVLADEITIDEIELHCGNIFEADLPDGSFDLAYSIGVLGEDSPFGLPICHRVHALLKEGGKFMFTVLDRRSKARSWKQRMAERVYPLLPSFLRRKLDERGRDFSMTREELESVLESSDFPEYEVHRHVVDAPRWKGVQFECIATKLTAQRQDGP